ncbi:unnamed protein product [Caenorhabditis angaria]|uniref:Uncharacterized protein n=1 Tax=Caenorhabditis angaria TaxID=860376 RepID=A0A9P1IWG6_9PELO|nr:unnamed protein product [Caenorhabditis angaria]
MAEVAKTDLEEFRELRNCINHPTHRILHLTHQNHDRQWKFHRTSVNIITMNARQKIQLAEMMKDSGAREAREEADEIITLGCRQFIGNNLGDEIAEEIEDMRWSRNVSSQYSKTFEFGM